MVLSIYERIKCVFSLYDILMEEYTVCIYECQ